MRVQRCTLFSALLIGLGACKPETPPAAPEPPPPPPQVEAPRQYPEPPPPGAPRPVNFPQIHRFTLSNGLAVFVVENHEVPLVSAEIGVRAGEMDEPYVAEMAAAMLREGTQTRTKARIDDAIEFVGGTLGTNASQHVSYVFARTMTKDLKLALTLMADTIMNPVFPEAALAKLKEQAKTNLTLVKSDPGALADHLFFMVAYPEGHPYGQPLWTEAEIEAIGLEQVQQFHDTFYHANNAFMILAGDVSPDEARELAERVVGGWTPAKADEIPPNPLNRFESYPVAERLVVHLVDRPGSPQAEIRVGNLALSRAHQDWPSLMVANTILGDDAAGRLFWELREQQGLTYGVYSEVTAGQAPGAFVISTRTMTENTDAMLVGLFNHIKRIRTETPPPAEVTAAIEKLIGAFPLEIETAQQIAEKVQESLVYGLPLDYWQSYRDRVASVTPAEVQGAAQKYIHASPVVVVVGDATAIVPELEKTLPTAEIRRYGVDLQPQSVSRPDGPE